jgi:hypothetical protein
VRTRCWYIGLEDPLEEYERRVAACMMLHKLAPTDLDNDALYLDGGRNHPFVIAEGAAGGTDIREPVVDAIVENIARRGIGYVVVDPFVACHAVAESDNTRIAAVVRAWADVAERTGAAIELVHHLRKRSGSEPDAADARGASALIDGVRSARILLAMSEDEADRLELDSERRRYFRVATAKANLSIADGEGSWRELVSVPLGNGEDIGAVAAWNPPSLASEEQMAEIKAALSGGNFRMDVRAKDWAGKPVANVLGLDLRKMSERRRIHRALRHWIDNGTLAMREEMDGDSKVRSYLAPPGR